MNKAEYIDGVMRRMNELGISEPFPVVFIGSNTTKVERHVEMSFRDAWRKAVNMLPRNYFRRESFLGCVSDYDVSTGTGFVVLPADYYVLSAFKMKGWKRCCYGALEESDSVASIQSNEYVRGNFCRPVCVVSTHGTYGRVLRYYSLPKGIDHVIEEALYVPLTVGLDVLGSGEDLGLDERLYDPLGWIHAGLVFSIFEKSDIAKTADEKAMEVANREA
jgi:hypothetical protein